MARRRALRFLLLGVVVSIALWLVTALAVVGLAMRRGTARFDEPLPPQLTGRAERLQVRTRDGESLGAWYLDSRREDASSVLLLHGRGSTRASRLGAAQVFEQEGCAVLLVTLRAHGDSTGELDDFGWSARLDVVAAVEWLEERRPTASIVLCATSLGAAAATFAAEELGEHVDGYVLECLYRDLDTAAHSRAEIFLPPVLDWLAYAGMRAAAVFLLPNWRDIAPIEAVTKIPHDIPVLLLAGGLDRRAPPRDARDVYARIADHAELITLEGADHDHLFATSPADYTRAVLDLVHEAESHAAAMAAEAR